MQFTIELPDQINKTIAGHTFEIDVTRIPTEVITWMAIYGFRGVNDQANREAKVWRDLNGIADGIKWPKASSEAFVEAIYNGTIITRVGTSAGPVDPVLTEACRLAAQYIAGALGMTYKEAAADPRGKRYFKLSEKGNLSTDDKALAEFVAKADSKVVEAFFTANPHFLTDEPRLTAVDIEGTFMNRARMIVNAKTGAVETFEF